MHTHQSLIPLLLQGCKCSPSPTRQVPPPSNAPNTNPICTFGWACGRESKEICICLRFHIMCRDSYRYQHKRVYFSGCQFVCVCVRGGRDGAAGTVYFHIVVPQKEVFITVPGGSESKAVMMSDRLSAPYMKMWLVEKGKKKKKRNGGLFFNDAIPLQSQWKYSRRSASAHKRWKLNWISLRRQLSKINSVLSVFDKSKCLLWKGPIVVHVFLLFFFYHQLFIWSTSLHKQCFLCNCFVVVFAGGHFYLLWLRHLYC